MKKNMGSTDKIMRVIFALVVSYLYYTKTISGTLALILGLLAVIFVLTSFVGFCPLYVPFDIDTTEKK